MKDAGRKVHRARIIVQNGGRVLENAWLQVAGGRILDMGRGRTPSGWDVQDHGEKALFPCLVNAHTHLELTATGLVDARGGFELWIKRLMAARSDCTRDELLMGVRKGIAFMKERGTAAVGDIATLGVSEAECCASTLGGVVFHEAVGCRQMDTVPEKNVTHGLSRSVAGHATHSTAPSVLQALHQRARRAGLPFSIHLAESTGETAFICGENASWTEFLESRGVDISGWPLPGISSVRYAANLGIIGPGTLCVHLLQAEAEDIRLVADKGSSVCLCPRSNVYLHGMLPDLATMVNAGLRPCLGTDSLASTPCLDMVHELAFAARRWSWLEPAFLLNMASLYGAQSLGIADAYGSLEPGKRSCFMAVDTDGNDPVGDFIEGKGEREVYG
ncbi:amidohydrolase family protein [Desulfobotulus sp. H1]|uniref:Amidohydrolase family protein n=1 Tax=Desulfobotulus pelophilus TaxID=2823377 RepID=A0ABT3N9E2_9BACT|nr:amidohydrolase family protein [Desulfobotulus pelophilus]MCW7754087.1 amidohydrolase family protein [Desulfobotulus pelophilus]